MDSKWPMGLTETSMYHSIDSACWWKNTFPTYHLSRTRFTNQCRKKIKWWDQHVKVAFQPKVWCDKNIMKLWISGNWGNHFLNPATPEFTGKVSLIPVFPSHLSAGRDNFQSQILKRGVVRNNECLGGLRELLPRIFPWGLLCFLSNKKRLFKIK